MKKTMRYKLERYGPYVVAFIVTGVALKYKINYIDDENVNNAMDGVLTVASLIVGFIGAILPVILGMKNDSKVVVYVFQRDNEKRFLKYISSAIITGLVIIFISVLIYFKDSYVGTVVYNNIFYCWIFFLILFLGCTYRSISLMLQLIFASDNELPLFPKKEETEEMRNFSKSRE